MMFHVCKFTCICMVLTWILDICQQSHCMHFCFCCVEMAFRWLTSMILKSSQKSPKTWVKLWPESTVMAWSLASQTARGATCQQPRSPEWNPMAITNTSQVQPFEPFQQSGWCRNPSIVAVATQSSTFSGAKKHQNQSPRTIKYLPIDLPWAMMFIYSLIYVKIIPSYQSYGLWFVDAAPAGIHRKFSSLRFEPRGATHSTGSDFHGPL